MDQYDCRLGMWLLTVSVRVCLWCTDCECDVCGVSMMCVVWVWCAECEFDVPSVSVRVWIDSECCIWYILDSSFPAIHLIYPYYKTRYISWFAIALKYWDATPWSWILLTYWSQSNLLHLLLALERLRRVGWWHPTQTVNLKVDGKYRIWMLCLSSD